MKINDRARQAIMSGKCKGCKHKRDEITIYGLKFTACELLNDDEQIIVDERISCSNYEPKHPTLLEANK